MSQFDLNSLDSSDIPTGDDADAILAQLAAGEKPPVETTVKSELEKVISGEEEDPTKGEGKEEVNEDGTPKEPTEEKPPALPAPSASLADTPHERTGDIITDLARIDPSEATAEDIEAYAEASGLAKSAVSDMMFNRAAKAKAAAAVDGPSEVDVTIANAALMNSIGGASEWGAFATYMSETADATTLAVYKKANPLDRARIAEVYTKGFLAAAEAPRRDITEGTPRRSKAGPTSGAVTAAQVDAMFADPRYSTDPAFAAKAQRALIALG